MSPVKEEFVWEICDERFTKRQGMYLSILHDRNFTD